MTNKNEIKKIAKEEIVSKLLPSIEALGGIQAGQFEYAFPVVVEDIELFVTATFVAKNWYATKNAECYDLDSAVETLRIENQERARKIAAAAEIKAAKLEKTKK